LLGVFADGERAGDGMILPFCNEIIPIPVIKTE